MTLTTRTLAVVCKCTQIRGQLSNPLREDVCWISRSNPIPILPSWASGLDRLRPMAIMRSKGCILPCTFYTSSFIALESVVLEMEQQDKQIKYNTQLVIMTRQIYKTTCAGRLRSLQWCRQVCKKTHEKLLGSWKQTRLAESPKNDTHRAAALPLDCARIECTARALWWPPQEINLGRSAGEDADMWITLGDETLKNIATAYFKRILAVC